MTKREEPIEKPFEPFDEILSKSREQFDEFTRDAVFNGDIEASRAGLISNVEKPIQKDIAHLRWQIEELTRFAIDSPPTSAHLREALSVIDTVQSIQYDPDLEARRKDIDRRLKERETVDN